MSRRKSKLARGWHSAAAALITGAGLCAAALLAGCGEPKPGPAPSIVPPALAAIPVKAPQTKEMHELGREVYNYRCYFCHGYSGDAKTLTTSYLERKPRDFKNTPIDAVPREVMLRVVKHGRESTAMKGFTGILTNREMEAVTDFVRNEFMKHQRENTRYHTAENGWPNHERNEVAFPFARGDIAIDTPWERLDEKQQKGKRLFLNACITCHDHGRVESAGQVWESRPLSFPRDGYCTSCHTDTPRSEPKGAHPQRPSTHTFAQPDGSVPIAAPQAVGSRVGDAYAIHDKPPAMKSPTALESRGEHLFQKNCAFCHAGDGTSKSWIGSFLEPHPRDLTSPEQMKGMNRERLQRAIEDGLPNTSMPAWKHVMTPGEIKALMAYISRAFHPVEGVARH